MISLEIVLSEADPVGRVRHFAFKLANGIINVSPSFISVKFPHLSCFFCHKDLFGTSDHFQVTYLNHVGSNQKRFNLYCKRYLQWLVVGSSVHHVFSGCFYICYLDMLLFIEVLEDFHLMLSNLYLISFSKSALKLNTACVLHMADASVKIGNFKSFQQDQFLL